MRAPSVMTTCLLYRTMRKPAFSSARTASQVTGRARLAPRTGSSEGRDLSLNCPYQDPPWLVWRDRAMARQASLLVFRRTPRTFWSRAN